MNCREIEPLWMDWLYGELDPGLVRDIDAHLEGCAPCRAEARRLRATTRLLRDCADDDLGSPVATIRRLAMRRPEPRLWRAASVALFLIAVSGWWLAAELLQDRADGTPEERPKPIAELEAFEGRLRRLEEMDRLLAKDLERLDQELALGLTRFEADGERRERTWTSELRRLQRDIRTLYAAELGSTE